MNNEIILEDRAKGYEFLKLVFYTEPSYEVISSIVNYFIEKNHHIYFPYIYDSVIIEKSINLLKDEFEKIEDLELYSKEILFEYNSLFIGPGSVKAPIWKSFYFNNERLLFQQQAIEVRNYFKKYNLIRGTESLEAEDHLGFMLNFMEILSKKTMIENCEVNKYELISDQVYFLSNHLLNWLEKFVFNINENSKYNFYKTFGNILLEFIKIDKEIMKILERDIDGR